MDKTMVNMLFMLLRSAVCNRRLDEGEKEIFSENLLPYMFEIAGNHDVLHLLAMGIKYNDLTAKISDPSAEIEFMKIMYSAVCRYEQLEYEAKQLYEVLEACEIPFIPLKGSVIRKYYREPWMRTSCDVDVLVHREDLEKAVSNLKQKLGYVEKERGTHDVSLYTPQGVHMELHFDLVEDGRANAANDVLNDVWKNVSLAKDCNYLYEMTDEFFYFYHIAHMAKHIENGGCGIRPFIDLFILDNIEVADADRRNEILQRGKLLEFTDIARELSQIWFDGKGYNEICEKMRNFIISGGSFGTFENRVAINQQKNGGRFGYVFSRMFIPYSKLKCYYPILEEHRWLTPVMQVRRWGMLLKPDIAKMAKSEIHVNNNLEEEKADEMKTFLNDIGLK